MTAEDWQDTKAKLEQLLVAAIKEFHPKTDSPDELISLVQAMALLKKEPPA